MFDSASATNLKTIMDREIKFRGLKITDNKYTFGYLAFHQDKPVIVNDVFEDNGYDFVFSFVNPYSIGQFTGLKDKNGTDIYEGDIILYQDCKGEVYYQSETCMFMANFKTTHSSWSFDSMDYEIIVIGNIHENLELL